ncbi:MAG: alpha/beta fold hydrolase [Kiloniellales bacterium]|nr:alpha/beta fold hydrolase [Kiloniellales bacterium]
MSKDLSRRSIEASAPKRRKLRIAALMLGAILIAVFIQFPHSNAGEGAFSDPDLPQNPKGGRLPTLHHPAPATSPFALPTMGGLQLWQDRAYYAGWRVQSHIWTGHYRLLDPDDLQQSWGGSDDVRAVFDEIRENGGIRPRSSDLVILIHGWGRTSHMFDDLKEALHREGFDVLALSYPSTRASIATHAEVLRELIGDLEGTKRVSFITHSLGGIVLRRLLVENPIFANGVELERAVMIAPPNQGSVMAETLGEHQAFHWIGGPVAKELTPESLEDLPPPNIPFMIIAGHSGTAEGWNPVIEGDDDGIVGLEETYLEGADAYLRIEAVHTFIAADPEAIKAAIAFLKN